MAKAAIDIDKLAREALRDKTPKPDLLKDGIPFEPGGFYVVIEPIEPKKESAGGIALATITQEAEGYQIQVGRVLKCGPTAFDGQTESGIELGRFTADIQRAKDLIGKHVVFQRHTGNLLTLRASGQRVIVMTLSEILGVTDDPDAWKFYA